MKQGLIVRCDQGIPRRLGVLHHVEPLPIEHEEPDGFGYRRYYSHTEPWKGLFTPVLEITERLQRHARVHSDLSEYASGRIRPGPDVRR